MMRSCRCRGSSRLSAVRAPHNGRREKNLSVRLSIGAQRGQGRTARAPRSGGGGWPTDARARRGSSICGGTVRTAEGRLLQWSMLGYSSRYAPPPDPRRSCFAPRHRPLSKPRDRSHHGVVSNPVLLPSERDHIRRACRARWWRDDEADGRKASAQVHQVWQAARRFTAGLVAAERRSSCQIL